GKAMLGVGIQVSLLHGLAIEMSKDEAKRKVQVSKNEQLFHEANGHLAPLTGSQPDAPKNDPVWKCITEGWSWVVVSNEMEDHIPTFPSWVQMAMNSSNSIGRPQTELELATTMATFFQNGMDLKEAITQAKQGDIKCQQSLPAVAHYVQRFAGGPNFPLIHFLGKFGKLFGGALLLEGDFFHALAHTDFKVSGQVFPMVRMGLWATMLTNPQKSQDGFAKVFTKADIEKLRSHLSIEKTKQAETMLAKAWETYQELVTKNSQMELHYTKCFGKFTVRLLLFLTQKQEVSKEAKYVNYKEYGTQVWELKSINDQHAIFEHNALFEHPQSLEVDHEELKKWKAAKTPMPKLCPPHYCKAAVSMAHPSVQQDFQKNQVALALHQAAQSNALSEKQIAFSLRPAGLWTLAKVTKKGALKLVPLGHITMVIDERPNMLTIEAFSKKWLISPWKMDSMFEKPEHPLLPFWWAKTSNDMDVCNLEWHQVVVNQCKIPILTNTGPVEANTQLIFPKDAEEEQEDEAPTAAKKKKRKTT
ncbi:Uncharacterized protein SCF082_LOCUS44288, partial [Durusdinium trenchii]